MLFRPLDGVRHEIACRAMADQGGIVKRTREAATGQLDEEPNRPLLADSCPSFGPIGIPS